MLAVCDICGQTIPTYTTDGKDNLTVLTFHKLTKHQDEIIRDDPIVQKSREALKTRFWSKKEDRWVTVAPMDNLSYDLQPTGKARKVSQSEERILGYAGLIKRDGMDE